MEDLFFILDVNVLIVVEVLFSGIDTYVGVIFYVILPFESLCVLDFDCFFFGNLLFADVDRNV